VAHIEIYIYAYRNFVLRGTFFVDTWNTSSLHN
jgi:hypothetical protein